MLKIVPALVLGFCLVVGFNPPDTAASQSNVRTEASINVNLEKSSVMFQPSSTTLTPNGKAWIAKVARYWKRQNANGIRIVGYGETQLGLQESQEVSKARAQSVEAEFRKNGISPQYLSTYWRGGFMPNDGVGVYADDAKNCRVDIQVYW